MLIVLFVLLVFFGLVYTGGNVYAAVQVTNSQSLPDTRTPASFGLAYRNVTFYSRLDHLRLRGWFIPGILPDGRLTAQRTLILLHGLHSNRAANPILDLSNVFARHGFAILAFDMRGHGDSAPAPLSGGLFEQRDVLGAVDFLRSGQLPYPELGHPHVIGGWGDSMGGATMLLAAAREPAIKAVVTDSAFAAMGPLIQQNSAYPALLVPGVLATIRLLYGIDYFAVRPVDAVEQIAPRPIFFIHGSADSVVPASNMQELADAARKAPNAHVQTWLIQGADHIQSYNVMREEYISRVVAFFTNALGPDRG